MPTDKTQDDTTRSPRAELQARWLDALLPRVEEMGWTDRALKAAAEDAGLSPGEQRLAAPNDVDTLLQAFLDRAEDAMLSALDAEALEEMRVRDRVAFAVMAWLDALEPHKSAVRKSISRGLMPWRAPDAAGRTWGLADKIWTGIGDTSEDYNKYTKRGLLSSILPPVTLYWLNTDDREKTRAFLNARIDNVMMLGKTAGQVIGPVLDLFSGGKKKEPAE